MLRIPVTLISMLAVMAFGATAPQAESAESPNIHTARTTATLVTDTDSVAPGHPIQVALHLRLAPGWHTYWQNPGDAGAAPTLDLTLPAGTSAGPIAWPTPQRQHDGPLTTYGYDGDLLLVRTITPPATPPGGGTLTIKAQASWLVCKDICVPEDASFSLDLPPGPATPSPQAALFATAAASLPRPAPFAAELIPASATHATLAVTDPSLTPASVRDAWFIPTDADSVVNSAPQRVTWQDNRLQLSLERPEDHKPAPLSGLLVLRDAGGQTSAYNLTARPGAAEPAETTASLPELLGLAFLGGIILNLMPCVFPILAMKAIGIARLSGSGRSHVRLQAVSYAAGVLVTFAVLAAVIIAFHAAGIAAGWGFQFQSPVFVTLIAWLLFVVGLALSGALTLPGFGWIGVGSSLTQRQGHVGSFFTGLLAVLVATPCTAPFMGAAIAGALTAPPFVTLLIFLTLGLGLASPTLILVAVPHAADLLPRPGRWMDLLKQALAFPMYAAAIWLVWVLSLEAGPNGILSALGGMLVLGIGIWARQAATGRTGRRIGNAVASAALLTALAIVALMPATSANTATLAATESAEPFTPERLAALRAEGRPVFVNMTAAWCVTCLINERVALSPLAVRQAFAARHVAYLLGDWTRQDPAVTSYLRNAGREGVPLYIFYPAGGGAPVVLPQILTEAAVLRQLTAGG